MNNKVFDKKEKLDNQFDELFCMLKHDLEINDLESAKMTFRKFEKVINQTIEIEIKINSIKRGYD